MDDSFKAWLKDAVERLVWTFIQGSLSVLALDSFGWVDLNDITVWEAAAGGGVAAALSAIKSIAASRLAARNTAQLGVKTYAYEEAGPGSAGADL